MNDVRDSRRKHLDELDKGDGMKITKEWLKENRACLEGEKWFANQNETDAKKVILDLLAQYHSDWANWTIVKLMSYEQKIRYAIYAAEKVLKLYEGKYPENKAPRNAIEAAKAYLKNPSAENKVAAYAAAADARAAAAAADGFAADAAYAAADAAADAAYAEIKSEIIMYGIELIGD